MGFRQAGCALVCLSVWSMATSAQAPESRAWPTRFEVASIKPSESGGTRYSSYWSPGRLVITNMPLRRIITRAYDITFQMERFLLAAGSSKILDRSFDIQATTPGDVPEGQIRPMIRNLLTERFKLRVHWEDRPTPVYALKLARPGQFGPELRPSAHNCRVVQAALAQKSEKPSDTNRPRDARRRPLCWSEAGDERSALGVQVTRSAGSMADFIADAQRYMDRPLVDATGLQGNFEWQITMQLTVPGRGDVADNSQSDIPQRFDVALSRQLGLTLEGRTAPVKVLVIDSVEMPTPN